MGTKRKKRKVEDDIRLAAFEKQCEMIADAVKYIQANHNELLSADEVAKMCGMSKSTFLRLSSSGGAPGSIKLERLRRWRRLEILAWISKGCPTHEKRSGATQRRIACKDGTFDKKEGKE